MRELGLISVLEKKLVTEEEEIATIVLFYVFYLG